MARKAKKEDDPLRQYVILDPATMKTPPGRFVFIPVDTDDTANRMCWAIALAAYADALNVFGRKEKSMKVVQLAAEMANDTKMRHPELFARKENKTHRSRGKGRSGSEGILGNERWNVRLVSKDKQELDPMPRKRKKL